MALAAVTIWIIVDGFRNRRRFSLIGIFVFLVPAVFLGYLEYQYQEDVNELKDAVQVLTKDDEVNFSCQRLFEGLFDTESSKQVNQGGDKDIILKYKPCDAIISWMNSETKSQATEQQIEALHLLSNEMVRTAGITDPDKRECLAIKNDKVVIQYLGATEAQAIGIANYYRQKLVDPTFKSHNPSCV